MNALMMYTVILMASQQQQQVRAFDATQPKVVFKTEHSKKAYNWWNSRPRGVLFVQDEGAGSPELVKKGAL